MAENKVRFGLSNVAIAMIKDDGTYDTPVKIPGAVNLSTSPEGDTEKFYADNCAYYTISANAGYTGDLEMALVPDDIKSKIYGWELDKNGALIEDANAVAKPFALLFEVQGDKRARRNVFFNVTATRPEDENATTEESATPTTETVSISMIGQDFNGKTLVRASLEKSETNAAIYDAFYDAVYTPSF